MPCQIADPLVLWELLESWTVTETFRLCSINIGGKCSIFNMRSTCAQLCSIRSIGTWVKLCWNLLHWWPQLIRRGWPDLEIRRAYFVIASCAHNRRTRPTVIKCFYRIENLKRHMLTDNLSQDFNEWAHFIITTCVQNLLPYTRLWYIWRRKKIAASGFCRSIHLCFYLFSLSLQ